METQNSNPNSFDRSGRYESGLASLVKSLKWAFALLLVAIIGMLIYFFTWGGYLSVEPQQAVVVVRFGKVLEPCYTSGGHWFMPYPVHRFVRIQTNQQFFKLPNKVVDKLGEWASFEYWGPRGEKESVIRMVTSWATDTNEVDKLIENIKTL